MKSLKPFLCGCAHTQHRYYTLKRHESQFFLQTIFMTFLFIIWINDECSNDDDDVDAHQMPSIDLELVD